MRNTGIKEKSCNWNAKSRLHKERGPKRYSILATGEEKSVPFTERGCKTVNNQYSSEPNPQPAIPLLIGNDEILGMVSIASHDIRGSLVSAIAALKLLYKGYYGGITPCVSDELCTLMIRLGGVVELMEESSSRIYAFKNSCDHMVEKLNLNKDVLGLVLNELHKDIKDNETLIYNWLERAPNETLLIEGNRFLLKAVFRNLLKNAIKYGGRGTKVAIGLKDTKECIIVNIFNTGRPVSPQDQKRLFKKFESIGSNHVENHGGMGLGLYMVKKLIQKQGGDIWYEAKALGSNFVFTLPKN